MTVRNVLAVFIVPLWLAAACSTSDQRSESVPPDSMPMRSTDTSTIVELNLAAPTPSEGRLEAGAPIRLIAFADTQSIHHTTVIAKDSAIAR